MGNERERKRKEEKKDFILLRDLIFAHKSKMAGVFYAAAAVAIVVLLLLWIFFYLCHNLLLFCVLYVVPSCSICLFGFVKKINVIKAFSTPTQTTVVFFRPSNY